MVKPLLFALLLVIAAPLDAQQGTVQVRRVHSAALGVTKHYVVYLPPSYALTPARRYPVAYYLHGRNDDETMWVAKAQLDLVMDSLVRAGMPEMIVVMPDGDDGWWTDWDALPGAGPCDGNARTDEPALSYCVTHPQYARYAGRGDVNDARNFVAVTPATP